MTLLLRTIMRASSRHSISALLLGIFSAACKPDAPPAPPGATRVLVFSKTAGYRHESIEAGKAALMRLGAANNFAVDTTEDASRITEESLKRYAAVIFLNRSEEHTSELQSPC